MDVQTNYGVKIGISCTWGDGPPVCVNIRDDEVTTNRWNPGFYSIDLTGDQAIKIGKALIQAGQDAKHLDESLEEYERGKRNGVERRNS